MPFSSHHASVSFLPNRTLLFHLFTSDKLAFVIALSFPYPQCSALREFSEKFTYCSKIIFPKDSFRAALTCIRFYEGATGNHAVTTYEELFPRLHYLEEAKCHIEAVIAEKKSTKGAVNTVVAYLRQRGTATAKCTAEEPSHVTMSLSELNSHVNTINLQIEVTNFFHQCAVERGGLGLLRVSEGTRLATLFGNGHMRAEVVVQVNTSFAIPVTTAQRLCLWAPAKYFPS